MWIKLLSLVTLAIVFGALALLLPEVTQAAACCAAGGAAPALITSDSAAQMGTSVSRGAVIGDVPSDGVAVFRADDHNEITNTWSFDYAQIIQDPWQLGAGFSAAQHSIQKNSSEKQFSGLTDGYITTAYEFLPEYSYSEWRPKGHLFFQQLFPLGKSVYETSQSSEILSKGFYTSSVGTYLSKRWSKWEMNYLGKVSRFWPRTFNGPIGSTDVAGAWGTQHSFGVGRYFVNGVRVGARLGPAYESSRQVTSDSSTSKSDSQLVWNASLEASYAYDINWSFSFSYSDQTLWGPTYNTALNRSFSFAALYSVAR